MTLVGIQFNEKLQSEWQSFYRSAGIILLEFRTGTEMVVLQEVKQISIKVGLLIAILIIFWIWGLESNSCGFQIFSIRITRGLLWELILLLIIPIFYNCGVIYVTLSKTNTLYSILFISGIILGTVLILIASAWILEKIAFAKYGNTDSIEFSSWRETLLILYWRSPTNNQHHSSNWNCKFDPHKITYRPKFRDVLPKLIDSYGPILQHFQLYDTKIRSILCRKFILIQISFRILFTLLAALLYQVEYNAVILSFLQTMYCGVILVLLPFKHRKSIWPPLFLVLQLWLLALFEWYPLSPLFWLIALFPVLPLMALIIESIINCKSGNNYNIIEDDELIAK